MGRYANMETPIEPRMEEFEQTPDEEFQEYVLDNDPKLSDMDLDRIARNIGE